MLDHQGPGGTWTPEQLGAFVDQVRDDRFLALWMLMATTGLPVRTMLNLRRSDVDLQQRHISTVELSRRGDGGREGPRTYQLDPDAYDTLREHVISWDKEREVLRQDTPRLFVWSNGQPLDQGSVRQMFKQHCAEAALPVVPYKEMRFAYVVAALETGIPTQIIRERLGRHAEPSAARGTDPVIDGRPQNHSARRRPWRSRSY